MTNTKNIHLVCPRCQAVNASPPDRLGDNPKCAKCGAPLNEPAPVELNQANFDKFIGRSDLPVAVDFWATWCGPCKMMAPAFAQAARALHPRVRLAKVNTEESQSLAARFGIQSIPTMVLFRNGQEKARISGAMSQGQIVDWINRAGG